MSGQSHNVAVWFEIPVTDLDAAQAFYEKVLSISMSRDDTGPNPMVLFSGQDNTGVSGHLYPGKPAGPDAGPTIHLHSADPLEEAMKRVGEAGGEVVSPIIPLPVGRFAYVKDPDGNSIGLFNYAD